MMLMGPGGSRASAVMWVGAWGRAAGLPAAALHGSRHCKGPVLDCAPAVSQKCSPVYGISAGIL